MQTPEQDPHYPSSITQVVESGLCIGCGLCEALAPARWKMTYTPQGRLRPAALASDPAADADILAACPGAVARAHVDATAIDDPVWGRYHRIEKTWASDADIRFRAATGGLLTTLGVHLLTSARVAFILHCEPDPDAPMRTRWCISDTPAQVIARAGSRYGPSDTLSGLQFAIDRNQPFAVIAKPCDAGALRERAKADPVLARRLVAVLVMVCGGASDLGKSQALLDDYGVAESDVTLFRYRGYGNPGPTRVETKDGRAWQCTYGELWADEAGWRIQSRCKVCPDANGEAADIAAADVWPGANPVGEDAGFNAIITRTRLGESLYQEAVAAGSLVRGAPIAPRAFDDFQPHQVRKKRALAARLRGMRQAGSPTYAHDGLRIDELDEHDPGEQEASRARVVAGRFAETLAKGKT